MRKFNMFRSLFVAASLFTSTFAFTSCDNDNDGPSGAYAEDGVFVTNEGNFTQSNASVSYYNTNTQQVQNGIFAKENDNQVLGDVVQDMDIHGDRAFIVVNNSNKIEVVNAYTFKSVGVVEGLQLPRYFAALNNQKGYVTETVDYNSSPGRVSVIDLSNYTVTKTIEVGVQPEQLLVAGDKVYVANSGSNTVTVINTATDAVENTIPVSDVPRSLALDRNNNIWVLSAGKVEYNADWTVDYTQTTAGALSRITAGTQDVQTYTFGSNQSQPGNLVINGSRDRLYFTYNGGTFEQNITATSLPTTPLINRSFYGLGINPDNGYIYGGDPNGFTGDGIVHIYRPDGTKVSDFQAGIGPNGFVFN